MHVLNLGHGSEFMERHHPLVQPRDQGQHRARVRQIEAGQPTVKEFYNHRAWRDIRAVGHTLLAGLQIAAETVEKFVHERLVPEAGQLASSQVVELAPVVAAQEADAA